MLHSRKDDETYMAKRQRIEDVQDQNGKMKMEGFNLDDDDAPLVFKRNSLSIKSKQANSLQINSSSVSSQRVVSKVPSVSRDPLQAKPSLMVQKPNVQSNKLTPDSTSLPAQLSNSSSVNLSTLASKSPQSKHVSISTGRIPSSDHKTVQRTADNSGSKPLKNLLFGADEEDEDSEDDKPLSLRVCASSKGPVQSLAVGDANRYDTSMAASSHLRKEPVSVQSRKLAEAYDDSDDEKPLSSRFQVKPSIKLPGADFAVDDDESDDDKPLAARCQPNGLVKKDLNGKMAVKIETIAKKRPSDLEDDKLISPVLKKAKQSAVLPEAKVKAESGVKAEPDECTDDEDNIPIAQRMKKTNVIKQASSMKKIVKEERKIKVQQVKKISTSPQKSKHMKMPPGSGEGQKWTTLEHNGVIFPPPYKPHGVKMLYNGQPVDLSPEQEEVATMFAVMKETDYATKPKFIENFWNDWKQILGKNHVIKEFERCDFTPIYEWHLREKEKKKQMTSEEKKALKEEKLKQEEKYMWAIVDGVKEKVGNFRVEPPGLFRGRGEHPKMGKLKKRIYPEDITINIGKNAPIPECTIAGHRWKEVRHDNTVTWLAYWNDPINQKEFKYVFLAASSSLKGQSDKEKYEKARLLKDYIDDIRTTYTKHFKSQDATKKQIAVATYLIDRLALRAGNEKDDDEADTVGCCTLKVENVTLLPPKSLQFDFLGKDSIRYFNTVEVDERVYKAIGHFKAGKKGGDDLFDKLDTSKLNAHLKEIMPGLTAKVFRTYNASITLDTLLQDTTGSVAPEKIADYQRANKEVAILCNHQRSVSKSHGAQMERLEGKMAELESLLRELETDLSRARKGKPPLKDAEGKPKKNLSPEMLEKKVAQTKVKIEKMKLNMRIKDDLKTVALGTSKINYLDPRISVAWCKRHDVPIEKIFNKSLLAKFSWAMDVEPDYRF